jgi:hypothetical protein
MIKARVQVSEATILKLLQGSTVTIRIVDVAEVEVSREQGKEKGKVPLDDLLAMLKGLFK